MSGRGESAAEADVVASEHVREHSMRRDVTFVFDFLPCAPHFILVFFALSATCPPCADVGRIATALDLLARDESSASISTSSTPTDAPNVARSRTSVVRRSSATTRAHLVTRSQLIAAAISKHITPQPTSIVDKHRRRHTARTICCEQHRPVYEPTTIA